MVSKALAMDTSPAPGLWRKNFFKAGIEVDFQFTGRAYDKYFDMAVFNGHQLRNGLTFSFDKGQVSYLKTLFASNPITFIREIKNLDLKRL